MKSESGLEKLASLIKESETAAWHVSHYEDLSVECNGGVHFMHIKNKEVTTTQAIEYIEEFIY